MKTDGSGGCERCKAHDEAILEQVGKPEYEEFFSGKARESRTRYVCKQCGATWTYTVESGVGGHGRFWSLD